MLLYSHIFVAVLTTQDVHIGRKRWNTEAVLPILQFTSDSAPPSSAITLPRLVKRSTLSAFCLVPDTTKVDPRPRVQYLLPKMLRGLVLYRMFSFRFVLCRFLYVFIVLHMMRNNTIRYDTQAFDVHDKKNWRVASLVYHTGSETKKMIIVKT